MSESTREASGAAVDGTDEGGTADAESAGADPEPEGVPDASLLPWRGGADADVVIRVYVVTGRHGGVTIPESFCRECNLFVRAADVAAERVDADIDVRVASWYTHFLGALRYGGYHPPVIVVDGERISQGHDVPTPDEVVDAIERAVGEES